MKNLVDANGSVTLYAQWAEYTAHTHTLELVPASDPACETEGSMAYYVCTEDNCDKWFEDATGLVEITDKSSVIIKATGHKWDAGVVTVAATSTTPGVRLHTCLNDASHTKEVEFAASGVVYVDENDDRSEGASSGSSGSSGSSPAMPAALNVICPVTVITLSPVVLSSHLT